MHKCNQTPVDEMSGSYSLTVAANVKQGIAMI